jgi:transposase-like protein
VKLVTSDAHEGLKAAVAKVLGATWQRCRVHFMRNALAYAGKTQRRIVSAWIGTAFAQDDAAAARKHWREVADQARPGVPRLAALMDDAEADVLAYMGFPAQHRVKLHSTNPLERLNGEIKQRSEVVGIFPNEAAVTRLIGALLLEQNDEWAVQRARYMTLVWGLMKAALARLGVRERGSSSSGSIFMGRKHGYWSSAAMRRIGASSEGSVNRRLSPSWDSRSSVASLGAGRSNSSARHDVTA